MKGFFYAGLLALALLIGWALLPNQITLTIKNAGDEPLTGVVVHVTGNSYVAGDLAPGASTTLKVRSTGESHVELASANKPRLRVDCYFEPGYSGRISVEVTAQRVIAVQSALEPAALF